MARKIVIGDIHGALSALEQLIALIKPEKTDELIFMGDYVDGWPESARVIDYLIDLENTTHCIFIKGNHDAWAEEWLRTGLADPEWVQHGGKETIQSYKGFGKGQKDIHILFFSKLVHYVTDEDNRLYVHAGFSSMRGPENEHFDSNFFWDRSLWEVALATDNNLNRESKFFPKRLKLYKEIFIGHTPTTNYGIEHPMHAQNVWNVDTGAAFKGRLTALDVKTKEFWQTDPVWKLYPGEKGRNER
jgi:serine/threonine protein phosphatase 1